MTRKTLVCAFVAMVVLAVSRPVFAQSEARAGVSGTKVSSSHEDEFDASIGWAFYGAGHLNLKPAILGAPRPPRGANGRVISAVVAFRIGHEWGDGVIVEGLAGLRATNQNRFKFPVFAEALVGVAHFTGDTVPVVRPTVGIVFPKVWGTRGLYVKVGTPILIFSGNPEIGVEGGVGFTFPFMKK